MNWPILIAAAMIGFLIIWFWPRLRVNYKIRQALRWFKKHGHTTRVRSTENSEPRTFIDGHMLTQSEIGELDRAEARLVAAREAYNQRSINADQYQQELAACFEVFDRLGVRSVREWDT